MRWEALGHPSGNPLGNQDRSARHGIARQEGRRAERGDALGVGGLYIDDVNKELDRLEGELLRLFPGDGDTVEAFLFPTRRTTKKRKNDEA